MTCSLTFTRHTGPCGAWVILPVGPQQCELASGGSISLERIDGESGGSGRNRTTRSRPIASERQYALLVKVRVHDQNAAIEAFLDDLPVIYWKGKSSSLGINPEHELPQRQRLGLMTVSSMVTFHSVQLHMFLSKAAWVESKQSQAAQEQTKLLPVPDAAAQEQPLKLVRQAFGDKYHAAKTPQRQMALAQELFQKRRRPPMTPLHGTSCSKRQEASP